ncbi:hypothetical protein [Bradyrhizobium sp. ORS 86]|uniref:hypothetical protein n=1 Tax=Bradyrhizobium sp. ORS 86 TaxID=1685970 RepID=UPI00388DBAE2
MKVLKKPTRALGCALLAATTVGAASVYAQIPAAVWDSSQLPETRGRVKQYTLTPRGDVDGLILVDGTEAKLPPHLSAQTVYAIRPGDEVSIRGLRARAIPLIDAASVTNVTTGRSIADNALPHGPDRDRVQQAIGGRIVTLLHGKRGEVNGALLDDSTQLRLPPKQAERFADWLQPGQTVSARGVLLDSALGKVMDVQALGASPDQMTELDGPRPPRGPKGGPDRFGPPPPPPPRG